MTTTITRANPVLKTRKDVKFGQIFSFVKKDGTVKPSKFLGLPGSDRFFSVNADTTELSSTPTTKGGKTVAIVGQFKTKITFFKKKDDYRKDFRGQVRTGDVFRAKDDGATYMHLGSVTDGSFLGLNTSTLDIVRGRKAEKEVVVVGYGQLVGSAV